MKTCTLPRLLPLLALLLGLSTTAARADDADLDVPGPGTRSWVSSEVNYHRSRYNVVDSFGSKVGDGRTESKSVELMGNLAAHERLNIQLLASRDFVRWTGSYMGSSSSDSDATNFAMLGLTVRPWGSATADGFGLVSGLHASNAKGEAPAYSGYLQPVYRFNSHWLAFVDLGLTRGEFYRARFGRASLQWKPISSLSLTPSMSWSSSHYDSGYPTQHGQTFGLDAVYHLTRNLSLLGSGQLSQAGDSDLGFYRITGDRSFGLSLGVRWAF